MGKQSNLPPGVTDRMIEDQQGTLDEERQGENLAGGALDAALDAAEAEDWGPAWSLVIDLVRFAQEALVILEDVDDLLDVYKALAERARAHNLGPDGTDLTFVSNLDERRKEATLGEAYDPGKLILADADGVPLGPGPHIAEALDALGFKQVASRHVEAAERGTIVDLDQVDDEETGFELVDQAVNPENKAADRIDGAAAESLTDDELGGRKVLDAAGLEPVDDHVPYDFDEAVKAVEEHDQVKDEDRRCVVSCHEDKLSTAQRIRLEALAQAIAYRAALFPGVSKSTRNLVDYAQTFENWIARGEGYDDAED